MVQLGAGKSCLEIYRKLSMPHPVTQFTIATSSEMSKWNEVAMKWANQETSQITGPVFSLCYNGGCRSLYLSVLCELWEAVAYSVDPRTEGGGKTSRLDGLWNSLMAQQFYGQSRKTIARWKPNSEGMLPLLKHEDYLAMVLSCNLKPTYIVWQRLRSTQAPTMFIIQTGHWSRWRDIICKPSMRENHLCSPCKAKYNLCWPLPIMLQGICIQQWTGSTEL